jgi:antitoxin component of MazEF toxin-antitoxin module
MTVKIKKFGGRLVNPIPFDLLREFGVDVGTILHISTRDGALVLRKRSGRSITEIVAQIDRRSYRRRNRELT